MFTTRSNSSELTRTRSQGLIVHMANLSASERRDSFAKKLCVAGLFLLITLMFVVTLLEDFSR